MNRTGWLAVVVLALGGAGMAARAVWPEDEAALPCAPSEVRARMTASGAIAVCAAGDAAQSPLAAGPGLTLGVPLDLNQATEAELALLPGVGPALARTIVGARREQGGFTDWEQVDRIAGIGPSKLEVLQRHGVLGVPDAGPDPGL